MKSTGDIGVICMFTIPPALTWAFDVMEGGCAKERSQKFYFSK